jgi:hypothetical protein
MATCCEGVFRRYKGVLRRARERGTAGLTPKGLDRFGLAMFAIAKKPRGSEHQYSQSRCTADWDRRSPPWVSASGLPVGFSPQTKDVQVEGLALHPPMLSRRDDRRGNQLESEA